MSNDGLGGVFVGTCIADENIVAAGHEDRRQPPSPWPLQLPPAAAGSIHVRSGTAALSPTSKPWPMSRAPYRTAHAPSWLDHPRQAGRPRLDPAVSAVKRILREAGEPKTKVGHGGTLDPLASGVLPIALGEATKLPGACSMPPRNMISPSASARRPIRSMPKGRSSRRATFDRRRDQIEAMLPRFTGAIEQVPPAYSALKIGGKPPMIAPELAKSVQMVANGHDPSPLSASPREQISRDAEREDRGRVRRHRLQGHLHPQPRPRLARALGTVGHVTIFGVHAPGRSSSTRRFRWTFSMKPLRRAH